jgi:hypothetical protein
VELLVAHPARHQQEGVVLALGHARPEGRRPLQEVVPVGGDDPSRRGDDAPPLVECLQDVGVGELGVGDEERHLAPGVADGAGDLKRLAAGAGGVEVVVAGIAAELVEEEGRVLLGDEDDGGLHAHHYLHLRNCAGAAADRVCL